jgi:hypothetical protein
MNDDESLLLNGLGGVGHCGRHERFFDRLIGDLPRDGERGLSHTLIGVTGHVLPAREVLRPGFLAALMV